MNKPLKYLVTRYLGEGVYIRELLDEPPNMLKPNEECYPLTEKEDVKYWESYIFRQNYWSM